MARRYRTTPSVSRIFASGVTKPVRQKTQRKVGRLQKDISAPGNISHLPSPQSDAPSKKKRKSQDSQEGPAPKKSRSSPTANIVAGGSNQYGSDVNWKDYYGSWPRLSNMDTDIISRRGRRGGSKRPHSQSRTSSYSQSVRDGESPQPWTRHHEEKMQEAGIVMKEYQTQATITTECRSMCESLIVADYLPPTGSSYENNRLLKILDLVRFRNEARIVQHIMPFVVPSPELLDVDGHPGLEDICEAWDAEWTQCATLCGPRPKPDFAAGISPTAFTSEEKEKLKINHTALCPNLFPENMYYPFLLCEVKGSDRPIQEAERQSMHSASIAVQAIVQLYKKISAVNEVDRTILAFSVAHNNTEVKIFGHFAAVEDDTRYFRRRIYVADFAADFASTEWYKSYNVIRAIYDKFFPLHLKRIKSALSRLRARAMESFASELAFEDNSQESVASLTSSQEGETFKRPALPSTKRAEQEAERLRKQLAEILRGQELKDEQQIRERQEQTALMERQMAQQKEMMEQQMAQQKEMMKQQMAQQNEESREQKAMLERQLAQQMKIIELLTRSEAAS